jgi:hypothetical protein
MARRTIASVEAEIAQVHREAERLRIELSASRNTTAAVNDELENFKAKVREVGLRAKEDNGWCDDGFNDVMRELGLPLLPHTFRVKLTLTATREVEVDVDASDLEPGNRDDDGVRSYLDDIDAAREYVNSELGYGDWDLTEVEVESVEALTD